MDTKKTGAKVFTPVILAITIGISMMFCACSEHKLPSKETSNTVSTDKSISVPSTQLPSKPQFNNRYTEDVNELVRETIKTVEQNYDAFSAIYTEQGLPGKDEYLNRFITEINQLDDLVIVDKLNPEDPNLNTLGDNRGIYYQATNGEIYIAKDAMEVMVENLIHEYTHHTQKGVILGSAAVDRSLYDVFIEGEACFYALMTTTEIRSSSYSIEHDGMKFAFVGDGADEYPLYSNFYHKLFTILGYQTMENLKAHFDTDRLIQLFSQHGVDGENFVLNMMLILAFPNNEDVIQYCADIENTYLQILRQKLQKTSTNKEAENLLVFYRYDRRQFGCFVVQIDKDTSNYLFLTEQYVDEENTQKTLLEMIRKYQLLPAEYDETLLRILFESVLNAQNLRNISYAIDDQSVIYIKMDHDYGLHRFDASEVTWLEDEPKLEFHRVV